MKLIITIATVVILFAASMAESGALYLCYLCEASNECLTIKQPLEKPKYSPACQADCSERTSCSPLEEGSPPLKSQKTADNNRRVLCNISVECGKLKHQCFPPIDPPELISTTGERNTIIDEQDLELGELSTFGIVPEDSPFILYLSNHIKIHPTISMTILRC